MKIARVLLWTILYLISQTLSAQAPGYQGKRFFFILGVSTNPAIDGPTQNNRGQESFQNPEGNGIGLNYEFDGSFSFVTGRYSTVSFSVGQYYTGAVTEARTVSPFFSENSPGSSFDMHDLFYRLNVRSVSLHHSIYRRKKGGLAPFGNYFYYGLGRKFISGSILDKRTDYFISEVYGNRSLDVDDKISYTSAFIGWASHQIFWDRIILKIGIKFSFPLNFNSVRELDEGNNNQEMYEAEAFRRVFWHEIGRFDIGIGYLLF
ncbi:MAG: hypothetical protein AAF573_09005 [Bacteroidota bacterium]